MTVTSSGAARDYYPDLMGCYQITEKVENDAPVWEHTQDKDCQIWYSSKYIMYYVCYSRDRDTCRGNI